MLIIEFPLKSTHSTTQKVKVRGIFINGISGIFSQWPPNGIHKRLVTYICMDWTFKCCKLKLHDFTKTFLNNSIFCVSNPLKSCTLSGVYGTTANVTCSSIQDENG